MQSHWEKFQESYNSADEAAKSFIDTACITNYVLSFKKDKFLTTDLIFGCNLKILNSITDKELLNYFNLDIVNKEEVLKIVNEGSCLFLSEEDYKELGHANINPKLRQDTINTNTESVKYFTSDKSKIKLLTFGLKNNLFEKLHLKKFLILINDVILGFFKLEDTIPLLQQELELDLATAEKLGVEVLEFLAPLSDPTWQPPADENTENNEFSEPSANELSSVTLSAPEALTQLEEPSHHEPTAIPEIRTMAVDMAYERSPDRSTFNAAADFEEPAYVSTQPIIERKVVDVPSYSSPQYQSPKTDVPATDSRWN